MYPNYDPNSASTSSWTQADYTEPAAPNRSNGEYSFLEDLFPPITAYDFMPPSPTDFWTNWTGGEPENYYIPDYNSNSSLQSGSLNQVKATYSPADILSATEQVKDKSPEAKEGGQEKNQSGPEETVRTERESEEGPVSDGHAESSGQTTNGSSSLAGAGALEAPGCLQTIVSDEGERSTEGTGPGEHGEIINSLPLGPNVYASSSLVLSTPETNTTELPQASGSQEPTLGKRKRSPSIPNKRKVMKTMDNEETSETIQPAHPSPAEQTTTNGADNATRITIADIPHYILSNIPSRTLTKSDISKLNGGQERDNLMREYSFYATIAEVRRKYFACPRLGCGAISSRLGDMRRHLEAEDHSDPVEPGYKCVPCDRVYMRKDGLVRHMKEKH